MRKMQAASADINRRLRGIRDLWLSVHNDHEKTIGDQAAEFFYKVGELLEGKNLDKLEFKAIDKARVIRQIKEG